MRTSTQAKSSPTDDHDLPAPFSRFGAPRCRRSWPMAVPDLLEALERPLIDHLERSRLAQPAISGQLRHVARRRLERRSGQLETPLRVRLGITFLHQSARRLGKLLHRLLQQFDLALDHRLGALEQHLVGPWSAPPRSSAVRPIKSCQSTPQHLVALHQLGRFGESVGEYPLGHDYCLLRCPPWSRRLGGFAFLGAPGARLVQPGDVLDPTQLLVQFGHRPAEIRARVVEPHLDGAQIGEAERTARKTGAQT